MTLKPKWTSESVGEYERSLKPIEQPKVRTGNCLRVGVCASEGHKIAPQRTWVGLTDEEVNTIYEQAEVLVHDSWVGNGTVGLMFPITLYKMFEAKLKEKNNG